MLPETKDQSFDEIRDCLRRHRFPGIPRISESLSAGGSLRLISPRIEINGGHQRRRSLRMCRAQRLMSASSYASYGSFRSIRTNSHQGRGDYGSVRSLRANSFMSNGTVNDGGSGGSAVCFNVLRPQHDDDASGSHLAAAPERQRRRSKRLSVNDEMLFNNKR
jgi:hypothetical protein